LKRGGVCADLWARQSGGFLAEAVAVERPMSSRPSAKREPGTPGSVASLEVYGNLPYGRVMGNSRRACRLRCSRF
jgi:hypothetical protein